MMIAKIYTLIVLLVVQGCGTSKSLQSQKNSGPDDLGNLPFKRYKDPDGSFAINLLEGWKVERSKNEERWVELISIDTQAFATLISSDKYNAARLSILSLKEPPMDSYPADLKAKMLAEIAKPFFDGWLGALKGQTHVDQVSAVYKVRLGDRDAFRQDVTYLRGDQYDPRRGYGIFLLGAHTALFISLSGNDEGVRALKKMLSSLEVEPSS
ncbi:MAG TPA: hypothetical protein VJ464_17515 [Blastocatellia bacterium]|nr:hypothetical protein [Blastocatellia bacterium]